MSEGRVERHLAAILAADVVGYSRLMGQDEVGTLARLSALRRDLIEPMIAGHKGRVVKTTGDGILIEFPSVVEAVACAVAVQREIAQHNLSVPMDRRIEFRVGINIGDVIVQGDDIYGDGVNVAARLETLAEPGGICVSAVVHDQVQGRLDVMFMDTGERRLRNIARPVRVYQVRLNEAVAAVPEPVPVTTPSSPDKPSIAVLPFQNMSGDPEQEYFVDGIVEEITTAIARLPFLLVIARNSAFVYKGRTVDVKQVARELGVRYVLEGSVRKAGNRVRITGQLIDSTTAAHIWADRFDGALDDIFDLQDRVASGVAVAIEPKLRQAEIARAYQKPTESLDAYDLYLRALAEGNKRTKEGLAESVRLARRALELDPGYTPAMARLAVSVSLQKFRGWVPLAGPEIDLGTRMARQAIATADDDQATLTYAGLAIANLAADYNTALAAIDRAIALNPNFASALAIRALVLSYQHDRADEAVAAAEQALSRGRSDPQLFSARMAMAFGHFAAGRYEAAIPWAEETRRQSGGAPALRLMLSLCGHLGRQKEAEDCLSELRATMPEPTVAGLARGLTLSPQLVARLVEGWRKAGLPPD